MARKEYILYYFDGNRIHIEEVGSVRFLKQEAKRMTTLRRKYIVTEFVDNTHIILPNGRKYVIT